MKMRPWGWALISVTHVLMKRGIRPHPGRRGEETHDRGGLYMLRGQAWNGCFLHSPGGPGLPAP